ncbi:MAG: Dyp-type peroxidase, partial [Mycobacterium sp.]|nr:Dyp-type peroxidase [Mycobacterium sp.]
MPVPAVLPQPVLAPLTPAAIFLVATIEKGGEATVHEALPDLSGLVRAIGFRDPAKHLSVVVSIGSEAWDRLFAGPRPIELHPFVELAGPRHTAPATPGDLLFHIRAESLDVCFELANHILKAMAGAVTVVDEVHG